MRLFRLAQLFEIKYKVAAISAEKIEEALRSKFVPLFNVLDKFPILKLCAESGASDPQNPREKQAVAGYQFCKDLVFIINSLYKNRNTYSLSLIKEVVSHLIKFINYNKDLKFDESGLPSKGISKVQFPHVSELIFQAIPIKTKHDMKLRDEQFGKAKTGLSRLLSISLDIMEDIKLLEKAVPEKFKHIVDDPVLNLISRFKPQRAPLSEYDIVDFIRQHGDRYGISSKEDWRKVLETEPAIKEQFTTLINALNRGKTPKFLTENISPSDDKIKILKILKDYNEKLSTNAPFFDEEISE